MDDGIVHLPDPTSNLFFPAHNSEMKNAKADEKLQIVNNKSIRWQGLGERNKKALFTQQYTFSFCVKTDMSKRNTLYSLK